MEIYFDESGDFRPAPLGTERLAFVMGLVIPETSSAGLRSDFDWFVKQLGSSEYQNGEPKGARLTLDHRKLLLEILKAHLDVMLVPVTLNLGYTDPQFLVTAPSNIRKLIESNLLSETIEMTVPERKELARRFGNLSAPAIARLLSYTIGIFRSIEAIAFYYHCERFYPAYKRIKIAFDRFGRHNNREELVFKAALYGYLANWSAKLPMAAAPELGATHPFAVLYGQMKAGQLAIDLRKILSNNIHFEDSRLVWQIRLADFFASTWARVLSDHDDRSGHCSLFRNFNKKTVLRGDQLLGIAALTDNTESVAAPPRFLIFRRMVLGDTKLLPCYPPV